MDKLGRREKVMLQTLKAESMHITDIAEETAVVEVATNGACREHARRHLAGTYRHAIDDDWRTSTHRVLKYLIQRGLVERTERGYYKKIV